ncbi:hypothetical protein THOM_3272 [Trachipleistophora hominis]|uniref:Uncharacterized protein n=1 Tax=Trachipleistophora hominis TaxID=72359 RepID=L7JSW4_TRAHO|nr:hypothetical protein THOM_3272 [Trachipleistophora hominis]
MMVEERMMMERCRNDLRIITVNKVHNT